MHDRMREYLAAVTAEKKAAAIQAVLNRTRSPSHSAFVAFFVMMLRQLDLMPNIVYGFEAEFFPKYAYTTKSSDGEGETVVPWVEAFVSDSTSGGIQTVIVMRESESHEDGACYRLFQDV
jgi:hypothetical protein